jgi:hypothetical protein
MDAISGAAAAERDGVPSAVARRGDHCAVKFARTAQSSPTRQLRHTPHGHAAEPSISNEARRPVEDGVLTSARFGSGATDNSGRWLCLAQWGSTARRSRERPSMRSRHWRAWLIAVLTLLERRCCWHQRGAGKSNSTRPGCGFRPPDVRMNTLPVPGWLSIRFCQPIGQSGKRYTHVGDDRRRQAWHWTAAARLHWSLVPGGLNAETCRMRPPLAAPSAASTPSSGHNRQLEPVGNRRVGDQVSAHVWHPPDACGPDSGMLVAESSMASTPKPVLRWGGHSGDCRSPEGNRSHQHPTPGNHRHSGQQQQRFLRRWARVTMWAMSRNRSVANLARGRWRSTRWINTVP